VRAGSTIVAVNAPGRVVATIAPTAQGREPVILFESADATNAWSQYRQSRLLVDRTSRALERVREMFTNLGATAREVSEAENDLAAARAAAAEQEGRMRALGFDPATLASESTASAWLMADVPEADLREVQRDGTVRVELSAFPAQELVGRADAVGDIVDPVTRTVKVRVRIADPQRRILPGMFGRVAFGQPKNAVVVVPGSAVITVEQRDYVFVRTTAGEFLRQPVTTQRASADSVIILSGVKPGTQVVTSGAMLLKGLSFGY
jgi:multidrug efflux pump subunit AcrA (membrane-fusion protein)